MTRFLLIRHGQSEWNAVGKWQGQADPPLTDLGRTQAATAAQRVGMVDAIVASDLERAAMTAHIIAEFVGVGPVMTTVGLRERDAGVWEGLTRTEIEAEYPGWLADRKWPDSFESSASAADRALMVLAAIADQFPDGEVLVVTHGGVIVGIEERLAGNSEGRLDGEPKRLYGNLGGLWLDRFPMGNFRLGDSVELLDADMRTGSRQL